MTVQKIQSSIFSIKEWQATSEQEAALDREARRAKLRAWMAQTDFTDISGETNPHKCSLPLRYDHPDFSFLPKVPAPKAINSAYEPSGSVPSKAKELPANNRKAPSVDLLKLELLLGEAEILVEEVKLLLSPTSSIPHKAFGIQEEVPLEAVPSTEFGQDDQAEEVVMASTEVAVLEDLEVTLEVVADLEAALSATPKIIKKKAAKKPQEPAKKPAKKKIYFGSGFVSSKKIITCPSIRQAFEQTLAGQDENSKKFFYHLYRSYNRKQYDQDGWVQIHSQLIRQEFGSVDFKKLLGLIEINGSYKVGEACKQYRIDPLALEMVEQSILGALSSGELERVDLLTGKPCNKAFSSELFDENRNKLPELVSRRIKSYNTPVVFNKRAANLFLEQKRLEYKAEEKLNGRSKKREKLFLSYMNDVRCLEAVVFGHQSVDLPGGRAAYVPAYKAQVSGRISHLGGGFQSASRELTAAAFFDLDYNNYDLKSAQPSIYLQMLQRYNISDGGWLQDYISGVTGKAVIAEKIGVSIDTWKRVLCAVLMGSMIPDINKAEKGFWNIAKTLANKDTTKRKNKLVVPSLYSCFLSEFNNNPEIAFQAYSRFTEICNPLLGAIKQVGTLIKTAIKNQDRTELPELQKGNNGLYIKNAAGMVLQLKEIPSASLIAKVQSHLLQGSESCLITNIISMAEKYGFKPLLDFHDGFLCSGVVPPTAVEEAVANCGIAGVLETKPFKNPLI
jgi:hypothetical protein